MDVMPCEAVKLLFCTVPSVCYPVYVVRWLWDYCTCCTLGGKRVPPHAGWRTRGASGGSQFNN